MSDNLRVVGQLYSRYSRKAWIGSMMLALHSVVCDYMLYYRVQRAVSECTLYTKFRVWVNMCGLAHTESGNVCKLDMSDVSTWSTYIIPGYYYACMYRYSQSNWGPRKNSTTTLWWTAKCVIWCVCVCRLIY